MCGQHLSESVQRMDKPDTSYLAAFETCLACEALERAQREQAKKDPDDALTTGRLWKVFTAAQVAELSRAGRAQST